MGECLPYKQDVGSSSLSVCTAKVATDKEDTNRKGPGDIPQVKLQKSNLLSAFYNRCYAGKEGRPLKLFAVVRITFAVAK